MNLKLTHTEGDVEFVRAEDVEIGVDSGAGQLAYSLAIKLPEGWVDYIRAVRSVERMPDAPFHYFHTPNAGIWTDDLVAATPCTGDFGTCFVDGGACMECSKRDCPHHDPLHYHHDGCPSCYQPEPTPLGDRIRQSLGERMSDHYREQLPPEDEPGHSRNVADLQQQVSLLTVKCELLDEKVSQLHTRLELEQVDHQQTCTALFQSWQEVDHLKNRIEMATRWLTGQPVDGAKL